MKNDIFLVRLLGWIILGISSCVIIAGLIANNGDPYKFGLIGCYAFLGASGYILTRFKKEKKNVSQNSPVVNLPLRTVETSRRNEKRPNDRFVHIMYYDTDNSVTERDIEILKISKRDEKLFIHAYCHLRKAVRLFSAERIIAAKYNGQEVNITELLQQRTFTPLSAKDMADIA